MVKQFKVGQKIIVNKTTNTDSPIESDFTVDFEITKRTKCFVSVKCLSSNEEKRCKIQTCWSITRESLEFDHDTVLIA